jgi:hypothetical protein
MKYGWALVMVSSRHIGRKFQTCHGHEVRVELDESVLHVTGHKGCRIDSNGTVCTPTVTVRSNWLEKKLKSAEDVTIPLD